MLGDGAARLARAVLLASASGLYTAQMREHDAEHLAQAIRSEFPKIESPDGFIWTASPPVRVADCVLSLNRHYERTVLPRIERFASRCPDVRTCAALRGMIDSHPTPATFLRQEFDLNDARRAETLSGVVDFVIDVAQRFDGASEEDRLRKWAAWSRPGDYLAVGVRGFGLAGFQYLRMLFGSETAKPDVHVINFVSEHIGRKVSDVEALYTMERAAILAHVSLHGLDVAVWNRAIRGRGPVVT